jgi:hypothetical protein
MNQILSKGEELMNPENDCMHSADCPSLIVRSLITTTYGTEGEQALVSFTRHQ